MSKPELSPTWVAVVELLRDVQARKAELIEREDMLKNQLRQLNRGDYAYPGGTLKLTQATKFNVLKAAKFLTPQQISDCMTEVFSANLVKAKLTTEEIQACSEPDGVLRVSIKESES